MNIKVYSYIPLNGMPDIEGIRPVLQIGTSKDPVITAQEAANAIDGGQALRFVHYITPWDTKDHNILLGLIRDRYASVIAEQSKWMAQFWKALKKLGKAPDCITMDNSDNDPLNFWRVCGNLAQNYLPDGRLGFVTKVYADIGCVMQMTDELRIASLKDYMGNGLANPWARWTKPMWQEAGRAIICGTFATEYGYVPWVVDYADIRPSFRVYDPNGWDYPESALSIISSPTLYITRESMGARAAGDEFRLAIDGINLLRSSLNRNILDGDPVQTMPTLGIPSHTPAPKNYWLCLELFKHVMESGIADDHGIARINLFNAFDATRFGPAQAAHDSCLDVMRIVNSYRGRVIKRRILPEIPLDAKEIRTGNVRTLRSAWLKKV